MIFPHFLLLKFISLATASFWFHYVISLQKSAQCNVRSGVNTEGTREFGGEADILEGNC